MLSIVIIALNEEKNISVLLDSVKNQSFKDFEILVADAGSTDKTVEIAKSYGAKVVPGGLPGKARNSGADNSAGDLILFLDADTVLPEGFLSRNIEDFKKRNLDFATFFHEPAGGNVFFKFLFKAFYNWWTWIVFKISPGGGIGFLVKKEFHQKIGGFDESIKISEDLYYIRQASRMGKIGIIRKVKLIVSTRRYEQEGWFKIILKHIFSGWHTILIGPVKSDAFKYKFNHYEDKK